MPLPKSVLNAILSETISDANGQDDVCQNFMLYDSKTLVGWFMGYTLIDMDMNSGTPITNRRWICFDTEGVRTDCDPSFANIDEKNKYYRSMRKLATWTQQINIEQERTNATTTIRFGQVFIDD